MMAAESGYPHPQRRDDAVGVEATDGQSQMEVLARIGRRIDESPFGASISVPVRARAYAEAMSIIDTGAPTVTGPIAVAGFITTMFLSAAVELAADPEGFRSLIHEVSELSGLPARLLGRQLLAAPGWQSLAPAVALEGCLGMLVALEDLSHAAVFATGVTGSLRLLAGAGQPTLGPSVLRRAARRLLSGAASPHPLRDGLAGTVLCSGSPLAAALVTLGAAPEGRRAVLLYDAVAPTLCRLVEALDAATGVVRPAPDVQATERRLDRLRYDLHDGPQQDVLMLADDLRLFSAQVTGVVDSACVDVVRGRLDDLQARLTTLDADLRRICAFAQSPFLAPEPLPQAVQQLADRFAERSGVDPRVTITGDFDALSDSQQIALLGLLREALNNIREHSSARTVTISLRADGPTVTLAIVDDGCGFHPDTMLVRAARAGHLGLVGMHERIRLLGGVTRIQSQPGAGTTVVAQIDSQAYRLP